MKKSNDQNAILDTLLTGYLIDSITNYCGRNIEELKTLNLKDDFFTEIAGKTNDEVKSHLVKEFSKLDTGGSLWHWHKHRNLATDLAKYISKTTENYKGYNNFEFNPGYRLLGWKSKLYKTCENTNAELNYISKTMTTPHKVTSYRKTGKLITAKKIEKTTVLDDLQHIDSASTFTHTSSNLDPAPLAKAINKELLERFKEKLCRLKQLGRNSDNVTNNINNAINLLDKMIEDSNVQEIRKLDGLLKKIEKVINANYVFWQSLDEEDSVRVNSIKEMRQRLSKDSFACSLTQIISPINYASGSPLNNSKDSLKQAFTTVIEQRQKLATDASDKSSPTGKGRNKKNHVPQKKTDKLSTSFITRFFSTVNNPIKNMHSELAHSDTNPKNVAYKTSQPESVLTFFKKLMSPKRVKHKKNNRPKN